jgi:signal transduction histidine kinase
MHAVAVDEPAPPTQRRHTLSRWWWCAAVGSYALLAVDFVGHIIRPGDAPTGVWLLFMFKLVVFMGAPLWAWGWRFPRLGVIWWLAGFGHLLSDFVVTYPDSTLAVTVGVIATYNWESFATHFIAAYPTGRLDPHWGIRWWVILNYVGGVIWMIPILLFSHDYPPTFFYVGHTVPWLDSWNWWWTVILVITTPVYFWVIWYRIRHASPGLRRSIVPFYTVAALGMIPWLWVWGRQLSGDMSYFSMGAVTDSIDGILLASTAVLGLLVTRRARGVVGDLIVDLGRAGTGQVRDALAKAIGDPTLELALWLPEQGRWVDERRYSVELPAGPDRAVTFVGDQVAAIIHDPVLLDQPALLEAAGSAARFALENERLQAELRAQLDELRESRARIVRTGDQERRRLERDLHDGAQQRLLGLGMALQLLHPHVIDEQGDALLEETEEELQQALAELRELARGIHPAVLTEHGLDEAIRTLARRASIPVDVHACRERLPGHVETAAYFVVAESLANIAKYAQASKARIGVERADGLVRIAVDDDGIGGARAHEGSGLAGLADRLGALDGTLAVTSPAGGGTHIRAEIPCAP